VNKSNRVFAAICLGVSLWLILESSKYNYTVKYTPGPGFFPFWLGVALSMFSIALLIETIFKRKGGKHLNEPTRMPAKHSLYRVGLITLFTAAVSLLMTSLGFVLSTILFVSVILFSMERIPAVRSVITGLAMSACIYLIFEYWMEIGLPAGFWRF
jgi:putative tricarboxylic transport membrane protein